MPISSRLNPSPIGEGSRGTVRLRSWTTQGAQAWDDVERYRRSPSRMDSTNRLVDVDPPPSGAGLMTPIGGSFGSNMGKAAARYRVKQAGGIGTLVRQGMKYLGGKPGMNKVLATARENAGKLKPSQMRYQALANALDETNVAGEGNVLAGAPIFRGWGGNAPRLAPKVRGGLGPSGDPDLIASAQRRMDQLRAQANQVRPGRVDQFLRDIGMDEHGRVPGPVSGIAKARGSIPPAGPSHFDAWMQGRLAQNAEARGATLKDVDRKLWQGDTPLADYLRAKGYNPLASHANPPVGTNASTWRPPAPGIANKLDQVIPLAGIGTGLGAAGLGIASALDKGKAPTPSAGDAPTAMTAPTSPAPAPAPTPAPTPSDPTPPDPDAGFPTTAAGTFAPDDPPPDPDAGFPTTAAGTFAPDDAPTPRPMPAEPTAAPSMAPPRAEDAPTMPPMGTADQPVPGPNTGTPGPPLTNPAPTTTAPAVSPPAAPSPPPAVAPRPTAAPSPPPAVDARTPAASPEPARGVGERADGWLDGVTGWAGQLPGRMAKSIQTHPTAWAMGGGLGSLGALGLAYYLRKRKLDAERRREASVYADNVGIEDDAGTKAASSRDFGHLFDEYPEQCGFLARCAESGMDEPAIGAGIIKAAMIHPEIADEWERFFDRASILIKVGWPIDLYRAKQAGLMVNMGGQSYEYGSPEWEQAITTRDGDMGGGGPFLAISRGMAGVNEGMRLGGKALGYGNQAARALQAYRFAADSPFVPGSMAAAGAGLGALVGKKNRLRNAAIGGGLGLGAGVLLQQALDKGPGLIARGLAKRASSPEEIAQAQAARDATQARQDYNDRYWGQTLLSPLVLAGNTMSRVGYAGRGALHGAGGAALGLAALPAQVAGRLGEHAGIPGANNLTAGADAFATRGWEGAAAGARDVGSYLSDPEMPSGHVNELGRRDRAMLDWSDIPGMGTAYRTADWTGHLATQAIPSMGLGAGVGIASRGAQAAGRGAQVANQLAQAGSTGNRAAQVGARIAPAIGNRLVNAGAGATQNLTRVGPGAGKAVNAMIPRVDTAKAGYRAVTSGGPAPAVSTGPRPTGMTAPRSPQERQVASTDNTKSAMVKRAIEQPITPKPLQPNTVPRPATPPVTPPATRPGWGETISRGIGETVRRGSNAVRGAAYTVGGGLGTAAAGATSLGGELGYRAGLVGEPTRNGLWAGTGVMARGMGAGLYDTVAQPFTGRSAVTDMTENNIKTMNETGSAPWEQHVVRGADLTARLAPLGAMGAAAGEAPGVAGAAARLAGKGAWEGGKRVLTGGGLIGGTASGIGIAAGGTIGSHIMDPDAARARRLDLDAQEFAQSQARGAIGQQALDRADYGGPMPKAVDPTRTDAPPDYATGVDPGLTGGQERPQTPGGPLDMGAAPPTSPTQEPTARGPQGGPETVRPQPSPDEAPAAPPTTPTATPTTPTTPATPAQPPATPAGKPTPPAGPPDDARALEAQYNQAQQQSLSIPPDQLRAMPRAEQARFFETTFRGMAPHVARMTGRSVDELVQTASKDGWDERDVQIMRDQPAAKDIMSQLAQSGHPDPEQGFLSQLGRMDGGSKLAMMIGLPLGLIGILGGLSGGGILPMIMGMLGLGGAAFGAHAGGLFGNQPGGMGELANTIFGGPGGQGATAGLSSQAQRLGIGGFGASAPTQQAAQPQGQGGGLMSMVRRGGANMITGLAPGQQDAILRRMISPEQFSQLQALRQAGATPDVVNNLIRKYAG